MFVTTGDLIISKNVHLPKIRILAKLLKQYALIKSTKT